MNTKQIQKIRTEIMDYFTCDEESMMIEGTIEARIDDTLKENIDKLKHEIKKLQSELSNLKKPIKTEWFSVELNTGAINGFYSNERGVLDTTNFLQDKYIGSNWAVGNTSFMKVFTPRTLVEDRFHQDSEMTETLKSLFGDSWCEQTEYTIDDYFNGNVKRDDIRTNFRRILSDCLKPHGHYVETINYDKSILRVVNFEGKELVMLSPFIDDFKTIGITISYGTVNANKSCYTNTNLKELVRNINYTIERYE